MTEPSYHYTLDRDGRMAPAYTLSDLEANTREALLREWVTAEPVGPRYVDANRQHGVSSLVSQRQPNPRGTP